LKGTRQETVRGSSFLAEHRGGSGKKLQANAAFLGITSSQSTLKKGTKLKHST